MGSLRARASLAALVFAAGVLVHGQSSERHLIFENLGLPGIDEGLIVDETHTPRAPEAQRRAATRTALHGDSTRGSAPYVAGRLIVKFRDQATAADRQAALAEVSPTARMQARPSYADFDIVRLDPTDDAE